MNSSMQIQVLPETVLATTASRDASHGISARTEHNENNSPAEDACHQPIVHVSTRSPFVRRSSHAVFKVPFFRFSVRSSFNLQCDDVCTNRCAGFLGGGHS